MDFKTLNETIPYATGPVAHILKMRPYPNVLLAMPGRHADETTPVGGDFVVMLTDKGKHWSNHQFSHVDLFKEFQLKRDAEPALTEILYLDYKRVIREDADPKLIEWNTPLLPGVDPTTLLYACQCLAVAEHRRYARFEAKGGGKYLPLRFTSGIVTGKWTAKQAAARQKQGRPGVEALEKEFGVPNV